jgi:hypothetical protein
MAQHDYIISNATFPAVRTDLNNALSAIQTTNSGTSRPTGAVAGQLWLDTTSATTPTLKYYDGADDISLATIDHSANTVNWLDSTVSITGLSTTATGTVLTLSDSANTSTVNLIIDNDKEIRFREATANGTNYVSLSAPASLSADVTFTLPVAPTVNNQALISSTAGVMSFTPYSFPSSDGTLNQVITTNGSGALSFSTISSGTAWQSVKTSGFTAVAGEGYPCNTTSSAFTVTLPASPSVGNYVQIVDYAGTFATNNITLGANSNKIEGGTVNKKLTTNREAVTITYVDSTQGWVASSGTNYGSQSLDPLPPYSIDFLVVAGGAGGGDAQASPSGSASGGGGGAGGYRTSTQTGINVGTVITVTVGDGGNASTAGTNGGAGSSSSISGSGLSTITSAGGGGGGADKANGSSGGSGGGGGGETGPATGGSGNTPSTSPSQGSNGGTGGSSAPNFGAGGGGGASSSGGNSSSTAGGNGGNGTASSITGSSVTRAGGGGGGVETSGTIGSGGSGGGGAGGSTTGPTNPVSGTVNLGGGGGGGGGGGPSVTARGASGGKGVVILSVPTSSYSGTSTGSPTITTSGSNTILTFTGSGSYTA